MLKEANILEENLNFVQIRNPPTLYFGERNYRAGVQRAGRYNNNADRQGGRNGDRSILTLFSQVPIQNMLSPGANSSYLMFCEKRSEFFWIQQEDRCLRYWEKTNGTN